MFSNLVNINRYTLYKQKFFGWVYLVKSPEIKKFENHCFKIIFLLFKPLPTLLFIPNLPSPVLNHSWTWERYLAQGKSSLRLTKSDITQESELSLMDTEIYLWWNTRLLNRNCFCPSPCWSLVVQLFLKFYDSYFLLIHLLYELF